MLKLGIDEAGRGPVIGPLVVAGCLIDEQTERAFRKLGVKDSKQLTSAKREFLGREIKKMAEVFQVVAISPKEIDNRENLNKIEADAFAKIINIINKDFNKLRVIIDCPSVNTKKWAEFLKKKIHQIDNLEIICEHKADRNHIAVSAASILAKNVREVEMERLRKKYGQDIGSGYTSDHLTRSFLEKNMKRYADDGIFRKSWSTWKKAEALSEQKNLHDF